MKRITKMGNSCGLILDQPLMRLMNIRHQSSVSLTWDGRRLTIEVPEPAFVPAKAKGQPLRIRRGSARETFSKLIGLGLSMQHLQQLGAGAISPLIYQSHLQNREMADPVLEMMMDRLDVVRGGIENGLSWPDAVEFARRSVPDAIGIGDLGPYSELERLRLRVEARRSNSDGAASIALATATTVSTVDAPKREAAAEVPAEVLAEVAGQVPAEAQVRAMAEAQAARARAQSLIQRAEAQLRERDEAQARAEAEAEVQAADAKAPLDAEAQAKQDAEDKAHEEAERAAIARVDSAARAYYRLQGTLSERPSDGERAVMRRAEAELEYARYVSDKVARGIPVEADLKVSDFEEQEEEKAAWTWIESSNSRVVLASNEHGGEDSTVAKAESEEEAGEKADGGSESGGASEGEARGPEIPEPR